MRNRVQNPDRLKHILKAIENIERFLKEKQRTDFEADSILFFAVVKNLENIGEAAYMLTEEFKTEHPQTPWRAIIGMRHILVHGYYQISPDEAWNTAKNNLTLLKNQIMLYIKELE